MATGTGVVARGPDGSNTGQGDVLVRVENLRKHYPLGGRTLKGLFSRRQVPVVHAVDGISFEILRGQSLGIAGESGCGKTTTARMLLKLIEPSSGRIVFDGLDLSAMDRAQMQAFRRRAQLMFQNPFEALNPRFTILRSVMEPLVIHGIGDRRQQVQRALEVLEAVNLRPAEMYARKHPHQLSGGQLQRVVLARALVLDPEFLVADEPVSMLDVSVRAEVLNLMRRVTREFGLTTLYISHDLSLIRYMCEQTAVMYLGTIAEIGPTEAVIEEPKHPYTRALLSAVPSPDLDRPRERIEISDRVPSPVNLPPGCRFQDRCPFVMDRCRRQQPPLYEVGDGHRAACFLFDA